MGLDRTVSTLAGIDWASSNEEFARGGERAFLHGHDGLPVADAAQGVSSLFDGSGLFL